ncbi:MAG TPA: TIGR01458 family HAD-type hydrolase [Novosphingobium sp.]|nr:TIGR01458 family HAD-type hydrolase [Novosphingobium sp.]
MALKGVLLDLGGVVYLGDEPLPGAVDAIDRLHRAGLAVRFLTNATRDPHRRILAKLREMGLAVEDEELFTPAMAAVQHMVTHGLAPHLLVHRDLTEDFAGLSSGASRAVVVGDCGDGFTYAALNEAYRALQRGAPLLALANNRSFRDRDGALSLDAGPFVAALAFASGREPVVLGKPSPDFFHAALAAMDCAPDEAAMVGDDVESDVGGAMAAGLTGVLVRTGKYEAGAEATIDPPPDHVAADLAAAVDRLLAI